MCTQHTYTHTRARTHTHELGLASRLRSFPSPFAAKCKLVHLLRMGQNFGFLPARRYASAGLCDSDVSVCPSVCLSVRHTPVLCLAERKQDREMYTI